MLFSSLDLFRSIMGSEEVADQISDTLATVLLPTVQGGCSIWNSGISGIYTLLGQNPATYTNTGNVTSGFAAWAAARSMYDTISVLGATLLAVFALIGFLRDVSDFHSRDTLDKTFRFFIRIILTETAMLSFTRWLPDLCSIACDMVNATSGQTIPEISASSIVDTMINQQGAGAALSIVSSMLPMFFIGLLFMLTAGICIIVLYITIISRFLKLYILVPFGSIALSTFAGGGRISETGRSYVKSIFAYVFEIVVISVVLNLSGSFMTDSWVNIDSFSGEMCLIFALIRMIAITSAVKGADTIMRRSFAL